MNPLFSLSKIVRPALVSLAIFVLTACGGVSLTGSTDSGASIIQIAQPPADVARTFLDAWNRLDYQAMYTLISSQSQGLTPFTVFQTIYQEADRTLGTSGITYTFHNTQEQGDSVAITYDAAIQSNIFGTIADDGRIMRLVRAPDNTWKVAWSTMDIVNGYAAGTRLSVAAQRPPRGNILDHNGQLMVEQDGDVVELYIARQDIADEAACVDLLATILRQTRSELTAALNRYNPDTVVPIGDVDPEIFATRESQLINTCAIRTNERTTRRYVGHGIATHLIGYIGAIPSEQAQTYIDNGYDASDYVGLTGVEEAYESELAGKSERVLRVLEPGGMIVRELAGSSGEVSQNVTLTLDLNLQWAVAQAFSDAYNEAAGNWAAPEHSPGGGAVVIDIHTGAILALASYPTFDPGVFNGLDTPIFEAGNYIASLGSDPRSPFSNRATQEQFSPGSVFKIVTLAAASEENTFPKDEMFDCTMEWYGREFGDSIERRLDWRATEVEEDQRFPTGLVTMSEALTASCNPFFYQMGAELFRRDPSALRTYALQMGFGAVTGLAPIVNEAPGQVPVLRAADETISAAVGQGDMQVTVIQMARMVAGIANGGTLYKPYVVQQVGAEGSAPSFVAQPEIVREMGLSEETLQIIRDGMCAVPTRELSNRTNGDHLGTAWFVFDDDLEGGTGIAPYTLCGKTGTAQAGRIEPNGWFVAYAPADDPQIAVAVMTQYSREGSQTSAPIVRRILDAYFGAPQAIWPWWWAEEPYDPMNIPEGSTGG